MSTDQYEHFSKGDTVRLRPGTRVAPYNTDLDRIGTGVVRNVTNAGFRGLEYHVECVEAGDRFRCFGISAADLELVAAVPLTPWHGQATYRGGKRVGA